MATNQTIGQGALVLSANADRMVAGLDAASRKTRDWANKTKTDLDKVAKAAGSGAFVGSLWGNASGQVIGAALTSTVQRVGSAMKDLAFNTRESTRFMERLAAQTDRLAKITDKGFARSDAWIDAAVGPADKIALIDTELKRVKATADSFDDSRRKARADLDMLNDDTDGTSWALWGTGNLEDAKKEAQARLDIATKTVDQFRGRVEKLSEQKFLLQNPMLDPSLVGEINKQIEAWRRQADVIGMTATQAAVYEFKVKGASAAKLRELEIAGTLLEIQQEQAALEKKKEGPVQLAGAMGRGSAEAHSIIARRMTPGVADREAEKKSAKELELIRLILTQLTQKLNIPGASLITF